MPEQHKGKPKAAAGTAKKGRIGMNHFIEVCDVEKYYGKGSNVTKAVDRVSFCVDRAEFLGIYGSLRLRQDNTAKYPLHHLTP